MALTDLERMILEQAKQIEARERMQGGVGLSTPDSSRDYDAEIAFFEQFGTNEQIEQVRAAKEGRDPRWQQPNPLGSFGALVPPDQVKDAVTHQPMVAVQPAQSEVDDASKPVREGAEDVAPYDEWLKPDLIEEGHVRELPVSDKMNKPDLVAMLRADDQEYVAMQNPQSVEGDDTPPQ